MTKIGAFHVFFLFIIFVFYFFQPMKLWFFSFSSFLIIPVMVFSWIKIHQNQFHRDFSQFLPLLILKMQVGFSFRQAYEGLLQEENWRQKALLQYIYENVTFLPQNFSEKKRSFWSFIYRIIQEFKTLEDFPHESIDRLMDFKESLIGETFFRRKSRALWVHFGVQAGVLSLIYVFLWIFICSHYGFWRFEKVFLISLSLYLSGFLVLFVLSREKKWHI